MKFEVGELVLLRHDSTNPLNSLKAGDELEIIKIGVKEGDRPLGPMACDLDRHTEDADYEVCEAAGYHWGVDEPHLRKRYQGGADICREMMMPLDIPKRVEINFRGTNSIPWRRYNGPLTMPKRVKVDG